MGGERDASSNSSAAASMTEFREGKSADDDLRVKLEVKRQLDKDVSRSPVIEVGGERDTNIASSAAASMTEFREVKSTADDLRVELEVKNQLDKDRTHTNSEVGGGVAPQARATGVKFLEKRLSLNLKMSNLLVFK